MSGQYDQENDLYNPRQIPQILQNLGFPPAKKWGQNFLIRTDIHRKIVESARLTPRQFVIEIGPGLGHLTQNLLEANANVLAIEIDERFCSFLCKRFEKFPNFQICHCDALHNKHNLNPIIQDFSRRSTPYKVVSNLPYNVSAPIIINFLELPYPPEQMVVMVQKEVADRIMATPHHSTYGHLSVFVQLHADIRAIMAVPPQAFYPPPKVYSKVIQITRSSCVPGITNYAIFRATVFTLFNLRRKTVANTIRQSQFLENTSVEIALSALEKSQIHHERRAESLSLDEIIRLANCLNQLGCQVKNG